jgi:MerR family transcriptional regulator/heat shock protein HspR
MKEKKNKETEKKKEIGDEITEETPLFTISTVSKILGIHTQTLRIYDREGLVCPLRTSSNRRLYSEKDVQRLKFVCYLVHEKGVNISGAKIILEMRDIITKQGEDHENE